MELKGTKTQENIMSAFAGESQARNKYTYFAQLAHKEGYTQTAEMFERMADNEKEHAKIWFKLMNDGLGETQKNLIDASQGESYEWVSMYPGFAKQAREDGLEMIALMFEKVAAIEKDHELQFLHEIMRLKQEASANTTPAKPKEEKSAQRCSYCGFVHLDADGPAPYVCPVCEALGSFNACMVS